MVHQNTLPHFVGAFREATPYIHYLKDKTIVLAISSQVIASPAFLTLAQDINLLASLGVRLVLVHGVRQYVNRLMQQAGLSIQYHAGRRITDNTTLDKAKQACGMVRFDVESALSMGMPHTPSSNIRLRITSGNFLSARPLGVIDGVDMQYAGRVRKVDHHAIETMLNAGNVVLISPLGHSLSGYSYNLALEEVAADVAMALKAEKLVFLSPEAGVIDQNNEIISTLTTDEVACLLSNTPQSIGVTRILSAIDKALRHDVHRAHLISGLEDGSLFKELFTREGVGTAFAKSSFLKVEHARAEDIPDIIRLIRPLEEQGILVPRSISYLENHIHEFHLLKNDQQICGCVALKSFPENNTAELACLVVAPETQAGGHGDVLLNFVLKQAKTEQLDAVFCLSTQTGDWFTERGFLPAQTDILPRERLNEYMSNKRQSKIFVYPLDRR